MNITVVDKDNKHNNKIQKYFQALEMEACFFNSFSFLNDMDEKDLPEEVIKSEIFLIAVENSQDLNFTKTLALKEYLSHVKPIVIFMISDHEDNAYIRALKYGDGYLLKPFNDDLLGSALNYHKKHSEINRLLEIKNKRLLEYKKATDREHDIVESIFAKQFEQQLISSDNIRYYISPASVFNGDVLLSESGPDDAIYLAVGDVTGHGLSAAIGALPVYSTFRTMAKQGLPVGDIAAEMNHALQSLLPNHMLMALTIMQLNYSEGRAIIWSGGMPDVFVVNQAGSIIRKITSRHSPLSMLNPVDFMRDVDMIDLNEGDRLFFYTDGIEEARNSQGEMFGQERFEALFNDNSHQIFNRIIESHSDFIKRQKQEDDITLVEVIYNKMFSRNEKYDDLVGSGSFPSIPWKVEFLLSCDSLKQTNPLNQIFAFLNNVAGIERHRDYVNTILVELFNNALDHGVLNLDSGLKDQPDGFVNYYIERQKKISTLVSGEVLIKLEYLTDKKQLLIVVSDSGFGFDYMQAIEIASSNEQGHGHGLQLVSSLCDHINYYDQGSSVEVSYSIQ